MKPCPFCGEADDLEPGVAVDGNHFVVCAQCGAEGPIAYRPLLAVEFWDGRVPEVEVEEVEEG